VPERVLPHRHCPECDTAISIKEKFCSDDCKEENGARLAAKKRQLLWLYFGGIGLFAIAMLLTLGVFG
jgi:predicted nucleic acid-binding Zn ribbon protein